MGIIGVVLPLALVVALGAWLAGLPPRPRRAGLWVLGGILAAGFVVFLAVGEPEGMPERVGAGLLYFLPAVAAALVAFRRDPWQRPWLVVLLTVVAYGAGVVLAMNVWMWLGLPH